MSELDDKLMDGLSDNWWRLRAVSEQVVRRIQHHVLALSIAYREEQEGKKEKEERIAIFSGFVIYLEGGVFWVTASHVVSKIIVLRDEEKYEIRHARWWDNCDTHGAETVPTDLSTLDSYQFDESSYDVALVRLSEFELRPIISAGEIVPFTKESWEIPGSFDADGYYLIGFPAQDVYLDVDRFVVEAALVSAPVVRLEYSAVPEISGFEDESAFYGQVVPYAKESEVGELDIEGMSGGPLLAVQHQQAGELEYRLYGIQRGWERGSQILRAERFSVLIDELLS